MLWRGQLTVDAFLLNDRAAVIGHLRSNPVQPFFGNLYRSIKRVLCLTLLGLDLVTASTSVIATLGNIGPGLERVGAVENFAFIPATGKYFLSFCMILGRLELFTVFVLFVPDFWKR